MATTTLNSQSYLTFRLGEEIFAASVLNVLEILELTKITRVPHSPAFMRGVINLRGMVLPVIDARIKFGLPVKKDTVNTCIMVLRVQAEGQNQTIGALVDAVQEVLEISKDEIQPPPSLGSKYRSEFIQGMVKHNDQFIMILNINMVFSSDEIAILNEISIENNTEVNN